MKSGSFDSFRSALSGTGADIGGEPEPDDAPTIAWRSIVEITPHPSNGQGNGGCKIGTVFARLACGHTKRVNKSRRVELGYSMRCRECEMDQQQHMTKTEAHPYHHGRGCKVFDPNCPLCRDDPKRETTYVSWSLHQKSLDKIADYHAAAEKIRQCVENAEPGDGCPYVIPADLIQDLMDAHRKASTP